LSEKFKSCYTAVSYQQSAVSVLSAFNPAQ